MTIYKFNISPKFWINLYFPQMYRRVRFLKTIQRKVFISLKPVFRFKHGKISKFDPHIFADPDLRSRLGDPTDPDPDHRF